MNKISYASLKRSYATTTATQPTTWTIQAGIILKRAPIILRTPNTFESAYSQLKLDTLNGHATGYIPAFFETQKGMKKNVMDVKVEYNSREGSAGDVKRLDRCLDRSLYLVVKKPRSVFDWEFPNGEIGEGESLHEAAMRKLAEDCGTGMNVWFVGKAPVGHITHDGNKVFFLKSQILSGQVDHADNESVSDYAWVTKDELGEYLSPTYFDSIKDSLADL